MHKNIKLPYPYTGHITGHLNLTKLQPKLQKKTRIIKHENVCSAVKAGMY